MAARGPVPRMGNGHNNNHWQSGITPCAECAELAGMKPIASAIMGSDHKCPSTEGLG